MKASHPSFAFLFNFHAPAAQVADHVTFWTLQADAKQNWCIPAWQP